MSAPIPELRSKMIKCITFDLDDTLWAVDPVVRAANQTLFDWLAQHAPLFTQRYTLRDLAPLRQQALAEQPEIYYSVTRIRKAVLKLGLTAAGYAPEQVEALTERAFQVFHQARQQVVFFEHALETVVQLRQQGYLIGAITNGNADYRQVGLAHCMDFQFSADDAGVEKPDRAIFDAMLAHTGLQPEQVLHVGDHPEHDVLGAHRAGLKTAWVNLQQRDWPLPIRPDIEVTALDQLVQEVAQLSQ